MLSPDRRAGQTFTPAPASVGEARRFARATLTEWGLEGIVDDALLVVSELVSNAVMHAGTDATLELRLRPSAVRLAVVDRHPTRMVRMGSDPATGVSEHGRGLLITAALASGWGVEYRADTKTVWAEFAVGADRLTGGNGDGAPTAGADEGTAADRSQAVAAAPSDAGAAYALLPHPAPDALGLRSESLSRLDLDDLLALVVERVRDRTAADASYLLLADGFDEQYTVRATSGLPPALRGRGLAPGEVGAPDRRGSFLPVPVEDLTRTPAPLLEGLPLRSLVVAPVAYEGRVVGALAVASERVRGIGDAQAALLQRAADWVGSAVERARLRAAEQERRAWLAFLSDAGVLLSGSLDPVTTVAMIGQIVVPRVATWCGIFLCDERDACTLEQAWHRDERLLDGVRAALRSTTPDSLPERVLDRDGPLAALTGHLVTLPLEARGRVVGWLALGRDDGPLGGELRVVVEAFATRAALAIDNARAHAELGRVGAALQRSLLPPALPTIPGIDVGVGFEPAGALNTVGGDFYDVFSIGGGRWAFAVGDVCGGGPEAAAVTGIARHTLRAMLRSGVAIAPTLARLNEAILEEGERGRFLTLVCGTVAAGYRGWYPLRMVCAGHPPPFLLCDGTITRVGREQPLLGVLERVDYDEEELTLPRGSRLVTVTDGVLERRSGDRMLDDAGLEAELAAAVGLHAQAVADRVRRTVAGFAPTPIEDDMAVLVLDLGGRDRPAGPAGPAGTA